MVIVTSVEVTMNSQGSNFETSLLLTLILAKPGNSLLVDSVHGSRLHKGLYVRRRNIMVDFTACG